MKFHVDFEIEPEYPGESIPLMEERALDALIDAGAWNVYVEHEEE